METLLQNGEKYNLFAASKYKALVQAAISKGMVKLDNLCESNFPGDDTYMEGSGSDDKITYVQCLEQMETLCFL